MILPSTYWARFVSSVSFCRIEVRQLHWEIRVFCDQLYSPVFGLGPPSIAPRHRVNSTNTGSILTRFRPSLFGARWRMSFNVICKCSLLVYPL